MVPAQLAQAFVSETYRALCNLRPWSWLRAESEFLISPSKTGTCNVTRNSATVSGGTLAYATTDVDRQFRAGISNSIYTIIAATATSYTLDRVYGGDTAALTSATVLDAYVTVPLDFSRFLAVLDMQNNWQLHLWITEDELNGWDAQRSSTGTPWALVSRRLVTQGSTALIGRAQFELWPYATAQKNYPYYYIRQPETLVDTSNFLGPLQSRGDLIVTGALAMAAEWPGLEDRKNPYFNLALARMKREQFKEECDRLQVADEEVYMTWLATTNFGLWGFGPRDNRFLQSHDASADSYVM